VDALNTFTRTVKHLIKASLNSLGFHISRIPRGHPSETSKCRRRLAQYCIGNGVDLGFGGDAITNTAIRVDLPTPYSRTAGQTVQLGGDCTNLLWFRDESLDYVYSSHLLEDFEATEAVLREWLRVLRTGGLLVIYCPDEQAYQKHCEITGQYYNINHKHSDFSLAKVKSILAKLGQTNILYECALIDTYSWDLVLKKS
jgi:predicted SAM-dependent methyltransferase